MSKYNAKNKERRKLNQRPIEQRSEKICALLIRELFLNEVYLIHDTLSEAIDYSKIDVSLNEGLILSFGNQLDDYLFGVLENSFKKYNINYNFDKESQILKIQKGGD